MSVNLRAKAYIAATIAAGALVIAYSIWKWHTDDWSRYAFYFAVAILASGMKVTISSGAATMSLNFLFVLMGLASFSLGETLGMGCFGILLQRLINAKNRATPIQAAFNVASMACSIAISYAVYHWLFSLGWFDPPILLLLASGVFFLSNTFSVALVIGLTEGKSLWQFWKDTYFWSFPNYLVGAAVAWTINVVSKSFGWQATVLVLPVLFVIYRSHRMYVERLEEAKKRAEDQQAHAEELTMLHRRTIETLALAIEAKDQTTHEHLARVEVYAMAIGTELGLSETELKALQAAALLHDIGKLAVPEYIITKPGKLTPEEFEKMKIHPVVGAEMIEQVRFPYPVAPIVRSHHEKWDGSGYPDGISGEDIPIGARILSAVDCMDALASDRQYRRALPLDEAIGVVIKDSGKAFDPRVVEVLARRYVELERRAKSSPAIQAPKLSIDVKITRGAKPGAGFEESTDNKGLLNLERAAGGDERQLQALHQKMEVATSADEIYQALRTYLRLAVPYNVMVVYSIASDILSPICLDGVEQERFAALEIPMGSGLSGWVAENNRTILNGNPTVEPGYVEEAASPLRSALAVPIGSLHGVSGVLALYRRDRDSFSNAELRVMHALGAKLGYSLEQLRSHNAGSYRGTVAPRTDKCA